MKKFTQNLVFFASSFIVVGSILYRYFLNNGTPKIIDNIFVHRLKFIIAQELFTKQQLVPVYKLRAVLYSSLTAIIITIFICITLYLIKAIITPIIIGKVTRARQFTGCGKVIKVLSDDLEGVKHQKFIVQVNKNKTLLVVHNIDLAPRINNLIKGDFIEFSGEFKNSSQGGLVHWTHHDPKNWHMPGWIRHNERLYK